MIHRKWSLLTGPVVILGGIFGAIIVANLVVDYDPFAKKEQKKSDKSLIK